MAVMLEKTTTIGGYFQGKVRWCNRLKLPHKEVKEQFVIRRVLSDVIVCRFSQTTNLDELYNEIQQQSKEGREGETSHKCKYIPTYLLDK